MTPLTRKQKDLLEYLRSCDECPSFDEMRQAMGLRSKSGVHRLGQFTAEEMAAEAKRRGLVLGHIYRDAYGGRKFHEVGVG